MPSGREGEVSPAPHRDRGLGLRSGSVSVPAGLCAQNQGVLCNQCKCLLAPSRLCVNLLRKGVGASRGSTRGPSRAWIAPPGIKARQASRALRACSSRCRNPGGSCLALNSCRTPVEPRCHFWKHLSFGRGLDKEDAVRVHSGTPRGHEKLRNSAFSTTRVALESFMLSDVGQNESRTR